MMDGSTLIRAARFWCLFGGFMAIAVMTWPRNTLSQTELPVQLIGGSDGNEGTVRVYNADDHRWGAVCDHGWGMEEAHVICKMLKFPRALVAWKSSHFGAIEDDILYDNVQCGIAETDIGSCEKSLPWVQQCGKFEHAGVTCAIVSLMGQDTFSVQNEIGYPIFYHNNSWKFPTIHSEDETPSVTSWSVRNSHVACRGVSMSRSSAVTYSARHPDKEPIHPSLSVEFVRLKCDGSETDISGCVYQVIGYKFDQQPNVQCIRITLTGGRGDHEGLIDISGSITLYRKKHLDPGIDPSNFSRAGGRSLCRQMGYPDIIEVLDDVEDFFPVGDVGEYDGAYSLSCENTSVEWWDDRCEKLLFEKQSANANRNNLLGLICLPYYAIAVDTSFDHWSMEIEDEFDFKDYGLRATSEDFKVKRNVANKVCSLKGSYDDLTTDDLRLTDCSDLRAVRGTVGNGVAPSSIVADTLTVNLTGKSGSKRRFCGSGQCPSGLTIALWVTLPACSKPAVNVSISNNAYPCLLLELRSWSRIIPDQENADGLLTLMSTDCTDIPITPSLSCATKTLYTRAFTTTPFETESEPVNGCKYDFWTHVALSIRHSNGAASPSTSCQVYVNGHFDHELIDCESTRHCFTNAADGLGVSVDLGPNTGLDEVGLWRRPLGEEEILTLFHAPTDVPNRIKGSPLWVSPFNGSSKECPCMETSAEDIIDHLLEESFEDEGLVDVSRLISIIAAKTDTRLLKTDQEKELGVENTLDMFSMMAQLAAERVAESPSIASDLEEVGHNILQGVSFLQDALMQDDTLEGAFSSDEIHVTTSSQTIDEDFVYDHAQFGPNDTSRLTAFHVSAVNFERGSRISIAVLKGSMAGLLPRGVSIDGEWSESNVTSPVLSVESIGFNTTALKENVELTLPHNPDTVLPKGGVFLCAFYVPGRKEFSTDGCSKIRSQSSDTWTTCSCSHMTSFAILMAVTDIQLSRFHDLALNIITYTGCIVSIAALVFSLVVLAVARLKTIRIRILANQCVALLLAQLIFISAVENATFSKVICKVVAAVLHFLYLSVVFWMLVQGVYMYSKTRMLKKGDIRFSYFLIVGWVVPLVIVGTTAAINHDLYGMEDLCWLNWHIGGTWIFIGPTLIIAMINCVVIGLTVKALRSVKVFQQKNDRDKIKATMKALLVVMPILGVTWVTGVLVSVSVIFNYIFAICNAFQGLFVFIMQIYVNEEIKAILRLRNSRILPFNVSVRERAKQNKISHSKDATKSSNLTVRTGFGALTFENKSTTGSRTGVGLPTAE